MKFKEPHFQGQLSVCPVLLSEIACYADFLSQQVAKKEIVITRVSDPVNGESGVHLAHRAFDARFQTSGGYYYTHEEAEFIRNKINSRYVRNDGKLTCIIHSFQGGMEHFHFQIPADPKVLTITA